jgi:hypothetical protein
MVGTPADHGQHLTILVSVPDLAFPFFVYMGQIKDEANRLRDIKL